MGVAEDIIVARIYGKVRCGLSLQHALTVPELAHEFGLRDESSCYNEIAEADARRLTLSVLHRDMAYNAEVMSETRAAELADRFLAQFCPGSRYFSNGTWHLPAVVRPEGTVHGASWEPVVDATFDTGVLIIGSECSGCLWIEDED